MSHATTTAEGARALLEASGYLVREEAGSPGVLRAYDARSLDPSRVVGLVVIRDGQITYAEHEGAVFAYWPATDTRERAARRDRDWATIVRESAT